MKKQLTYPYRQIVLANPIKSSVWGFALFLFIYLASPIETVITYSLAGPAYLLFMYLSFICGVLFLRAITTKKTILDKTSDILSKEVNNQKQQSGYSIRRKDLIRLFWLLFAMATLSQMMWIIDRFYLRGVSLAVDALERRDALEENSSTLLSIMSAILSPAALVVWHIALSIKTQYKKHKKYTILAVFIFWLPAINSTIMGSRSTFLISIFIFFLVWAYHKNDKIKISGLLIILTTFFLTTVYFIQTFLHRLELIGLSGLYSIQNSVYAFTLQPSPSSLNYMSNNEGNFLTSILFSITNIAQYYCHGVFELFYQIDNFQGFEHSLGSNTFFVLYKFLTMLAPFLPDAFQLLESGRPHYGAFGTFFGPLHSDFGWFGVMVVFIFGIMAQITIKKARSDPGYIPLAALISASITMFPVINMLNAGIGFYLFSFFIVYAFTWKLIFKC